MDFIPLEIPEVVLLVPKVFGDHRGFFLETFRDNQFKEHVADFDFVQITTAAQPGICVACTISHKRKALRVPRLAKS